MSVTTLHFEPKFKSIVDDYSKPVAVFDQQLSLIYFNHQYQAIFGDAIGNFTELVPEHRNANVNLIKFQIQQHGEWRSRLSVLVDDAANYQVKLMALGESEKPRFVAVFDAEKLRLVKAPSSRVRTDDLTELPNRYAFHDALQERIRRANGQPEFAVIYFDVDHFKDVNELYGHELADELLKLSAEKIRLLLRKDDMLARLSGDEFAAIVGCEESFEMQYLCHRILRYFEKPLTHAGREFHLTVSLGVVFYPEQGETAQRMVLNAEKAMFAAKKQGRARFQLFDRKQSRKLEKQQRLAESMRRVLALSPSEFNAVYQPLYHIQSGECAGVEVLARWQSPEFGQVSPAEFIPLAESRGLINAISERMFECIRRDIASGAVAGRAQAPIVAVNVSAQQILDMSFEHLLIDLVLDLEPLGWQVEVELTESQLMSRTDELIDRLESWRGRGIRIAIDDFGTGYSCLAYLHMLPVDKLKIDRQFLRSQTESRKEDQIMGAIISMAKALDIEVLAEGVETAEQMQRLQELGCGAGQGFGLAKPQAWHDKLIAPL